jgi:hypothetical protein
MRLSQFSRYNAAALDDRQNVFTARDERITKNTRGT